MAAKKSILERKRNGATKKFIEKYSAVVIDIVEDLYHTHGVRPSSRTILYRLKKMGLVTKEDVKKVEALVAYLKLTGEIKVYMMTDAKRSMYGTNTYRDKKHAIDNFISRFKLDTWRDQGNEVLIMCEAVGYVDVIAKVANEYRCDYLASGGDLSVHWKVNMAEANYTHIIYIGDMDDKGIEIPETFISDIHEIREMQDDYRKTTLVRLTFDAGKYGVELEGVDVEIVRNWIRDAVVDLISMEEYDAVLEEEQSIKDELEGIKEVTNM